MIATGVRIRNTMFGTEPGMLHANGPRPCHSTKWRDLIHSFFASPTQTIGDSEEVTVITVNNGHPDMGLFERGLEHFGVPCVVGGEGIGPWINGIHKPPAILEALTRVETKYVLYGDSRDVLLLVPPEELLAQYVRMTNGIRLLYGAEMNNFPRNERLRDFESSLPGAELGPFKFLSGGMWIGRTEHARIWYRELMKVYPPSPETDWSEQGLLRQLRYEAFHRDHANVVALDHCCELFQNNVCSQAHEMWTLL